MIFSTDVQKLKTSLGDVIYKWMQEEATESDGWNELDIYVGDRITELMTEVAFNILLAQKDHQTYLENNDLMKEN